MAQTILDQERADMNLDEVKKVYKDSSGKLSDIVRSLGFAGIALIWMFNRDVAGSKVLPDDLRLPAILIVIGLTLDMIQYLYHAIAYWIYFLVKEKSKDITKQTQFKSSVWLPRPIWVLWFLKSISIIAAYICLIRFLSNKLNFQ